MEPLKIGLVGVTQANFQGNKEAFFRSSIDSLKAFSRQMGFELYVYPAFLVTGEDAVKARGALEDQKVDFLLIQCSSFAAGEIIIKLARIPCAIGLWGIPESSLKGSNFVDSTNSFCCMNMYGSIIARYLKEYAIPYKWFYGDPEGVLFKERFEITVGALSAIKRLRRSKVALVGGIAPGFNDLYYDERLGQKRLGIEIERNHEFEDIRKRAFSYKAEDLHSEMELFACGYSKIDASRQSVEVCARYYKAYYEFAREYGYDALAISCWPKIQTDTLACAVIGKLNGHGIPASCEGDLPGVVSMLLQSAIADQPGTLMDLASFDEADQSILLWHCGPAPECYADCAGACLTYSYQPDVNKNVQKYGLIHDLVLKPQPVTVMRITGEWDRMFLMDGQVINRDKKDSPDGSRGWVGNLRLNRKEISVRDLVNTILVTGFEHHYPLIAGDITEKLMEVAAWLGIKPLTQVDYQAYMQIG